MSLPQPHQFDLWRPTITQHTAQEIDSYSLVYESVPGFVQPMDSKEAFFYEQRGMEDMYNVFTIAVNNVYQRNDIVEFKGKQLHVVGTQDGCEFGVYQQLTCYAYPENARKRLNREAYES